MICIFGRKIMGLRVTMNLFILGFRNAYDDNLIRSLSIWYNSSVGF